MAAMDSISTLDIDAAYLTKLMQTYVSSVEVVGGDAGTSSRALLKLGGTYVPETVFLKMAAETRATRLMGELGRLGRTAAVAAPGQQPGVGGQQGRDVEAVAVGVPQPAALATHHGQRKRRLEQHAAGVAAGHDFSGQLELARTGGMAGDVALHGLVQGRAQSVGRCRSSGGVRHGWQRQCRGRCEGDEAVTNGPGPVQSSRPPKRRR